MSKNFSGILECIKVYGPIGSIILLLGTGLQIIFTDVDSKYTIDKNIQNVVCVRSGAQKNTNPKTTNFIVPYSKKSRGAKTNNPSNQKNQCLNPDKKVPYKVDPMYGSRNRSNSPGGGKPGGGPDQNGPDINRKIKLEKSDPIVDADV